MGGWPSFIRDLTEQMPLILTGLVKTLQLAGLVSVSGLLLGILVPALVCSSLSKILFLIITSHLHPPTSLITFCALSKRK